ncbi:MAG: hypothetical protein ACOY3P_20055 [Planctomycetota bacterium]
MGQRIGSRLALTRAPIFLRVVVNEDGEVDALDLLDDTPSAYESIHVYKCSEVYASGVLCSRGKGCRRFTDASYRYYDEHPADDILRDNAKWRAWCKTEAERKQIPHTIPTHR